MAKYRQIHLSFWQDPFIEELDPLEKYFYLYLMTNSKTTQCGCFEISMKLIRYETGLSQKQIDSFIETLSQENKITYNKETSEFLIINWLKHNSFKSPKVKSCIEGELTSIKHSLYIDYIKSILSGSTVEDSVYILVCTTIHSGPQQEQEQEEEQQQEQEQYAESEIVVVNDPEDLPTLANINKFFEKTWILYPNKKGKGQIKAATKKKVFNLGEEFERCIERYIEYANSLTYEYHYQNGSTFFNSGYVDYTDANYVKAVTPVQKKTVTNKFINHEQHTYDFDAIEAKNEALLDKINGE